ncbi:MAG: putative phosphatase [Candidatus Atelocyanobacterium thalassa isolate SIO64986]|uniref:Putative phosphatase n=1 Tax=Candidatus Atelocyanobacterium thalassa isolate SIO64986 TaxID=1527444 RepID=A0A086CFP4_9CHRO|nr:MAG: putative phosphatase [Candidatus Atelocyanobacterium thalassa isolate SIO64986]
MKNIYKPTILALDFDGVICNGMREYFQTAKKAYKIIWSQNINYNFDHLFKVFSELRPIIETGWEMPVLLRAIILNYNAVDIESKWDLVCTEILDKDSLQKEELMLILDEVRDCFINLHLDYWLNLHDFYPEVIRKLPKLLNSKTQLYIVTTKEGRFVQQLLESRGIQFPRNKILGKELKQAKQKVLRQILINYKEKPQNLWFVEDLLKTLITAQNEEDLRGIKLFLADWGYNTIKIRSLAKKKKDIYLLSLNKFSKNFSTWIDS